jgi:meromycolic acid enoyl-[acyl-carrier-protein] reductase
MKLLDGKRLLITGIVTTDSIAYATAAAAIGHGADVVLTSFERDLPRTIDAASNLVQPVDVLELDVTDNSHFGRLAASLRDRWGGLDGALHAVAFAPRSALAGDFLSADSAGALQAFHTSSYSYAALAGIVRELAPPTGGSIVGLDFDAAGAWPVYNWMGVCKAALESINQYVARDLGPRGIRSNLVAAGPLHTRAAGGIPDFDQLTSAWEARAPMCWDAGDPAPVADAVCFLFSDLARAITGEILHVDGGYHAMAANLERGPLTGSLTSR